MIPIDKNINTPLTKTSIPHDKNVMVNNTSINNINNYINNSTNTPLEEKKKELEDIQREFDVYKAKMESLLIAQLEILKDTNED